MSEQGLSARDEGARLLQAGDLEGAFRSLQAAVQQNPSDARAYAFLGICRTRQGDPAGGIEALYRATQLSPQDAVLQYNLGVALSQAGRVDEAKQALEQALQLNPAHAGAREQLHRLQSAPASALSGSAAAPPAVPPVTPAAAAPPVWTPPIPNASEPTVANPPVWSPAPAGTAPGGWNPTPGAGYSPDASTGEPAPAWTPAPPSAAGPQHDAFTGSPAAMYYAQDQTYGGKPPSLGLRLLRGWGWGIVYGQWWTLWTLVSAFVGIGGRPTFNAAFFFGIAVYAVGAGFFGSLVGLIIGAANLDEDRGLYVGVGAGLLLLGLEFLMSQSPSALINIFFYFFTGRYIGRGIAGRVQQPVAS